MQTNQNTADLTATILRIADADRYIQRLEEMLARAANQGEAGVPRAEVMGYLQELQLARSKFESSRDALMDNLGEGARIAALQALNVMDSPEERAYDDITRMAANLCSTPIALVSLVDGSRQWFKSRVGLQAKETPRELAFCVHAIQTPDRAMVVHDAQADPRFMDNALVTGDPHIRFYAGAPLVTSGGHALGTLCVIDTVPRELTPEQLKELEFLANQVIATMEKRHEPS